jgi:ABC-type antimicrobial peptide transport system permease subunit
MTIVGILAGAAGAWFAARFMGALLFDVNPSAPSSIALPLACLLLSCALSALIPILRATRIDPTTALRTE